MGDIRRIFAAGMTAAALIIGAGAQTAVAASSEAAAPAAPPGNSGYITLWDDINYRDRYVAFAPGEFSRDLDDLGFEDKASSYVNKTNRFWLVYRDKNFSGKALCVRPKSHLNTLERVNFGDEISSIKDAGASLSGCAGATPIGDPN